MPAMEERMLYWCSVCVNVVLSLGVCIYICIPPWINVKDINNVSKDSPLHYHSFNKKSWYIYSPMHTSVIRQATIVCPCSYFERFCYWFIVWHLGWWFVNVDEELGWVPAAYLESMKSDNDEEGQNTKFAPGQGMKWRASGGGGRWVRYSQSESEVNKNPFLLKFLRLQEIFLVRISKSSNMATFFVFHQK